MLPKIRSGNDLRVGIELSVNVGSPSAEAMEIELKQILGDLGLDGHVRVGRSWAGNNLRYIQHGHGCHRCRQVQLPFYSPETVGRRDQYVDAYFGREYNWPEDSQFRREFWPEGDAVEVMTRAIQSTFHPVGREELLPDLAQFDPEMLHLTLGLLFRYDP